MMGHSEIPINPDFADRLFEYVYCDLGQRWEFCQNTNDHTRLYHQLNMARLLRHLLIDGTPLAPIVARRHKFKILFLVAQLGPPPPGLRDIPPTYANAVPDISNRPPGYYVHPYDRDGYLNHKIANLGDVWVTVRDVIDFLANAYGGVHLVPHLKDDAHKHFARFNNQLHVFDQGVMFDRLDQIVPTALECLAPLRQAIINYHDRVDPAGRPPEA